MVNNVENVYLNASFGLTPPYTVSVRGTRVNVNAVTTQTNVIGQDYALVISSDDQALAAPLTVTDAGDDDATVTPLITPANNGVALLHQRVGANEPNLAEYPGGLYPAPGSTNGSLAQWHFFYFTNINYGGDEHRSLRHQRRGLHQRHLRHFFAADADHSQFFAGQPVVSGGQQRGPGFVCFDQSGACSIWTRRRWRGRPNRWGRGGARRSCSPTSPRCRPSTLESSRRASRGATLRFSRR